jgi:hypothetical protein
MARTPKPNPMDHMIAPIDVTFEQGVEVRARAAAANMTLTEYVRRCAKGETVPLVLNLKQCRKAVKGSWEPSPGYIVIPPIRLTEDDDTIIRARAAGGSLADYVRNSALGTTPDVKAPAPATAQAS